MFRLRLVRETTNFDFFGTSKYTFGLSVLGVIASIILFFTMGLNYGIDFKGGTMMTVSTPEHVEVSDYRTKLGEIGYDASVNQIFDPAAEINDSEPNQVTIRISQQGDDDEIQLEAISNIQSELGAAFPGIKFLQTDSVGGKVSGELVQAGILAVVLANFAVLFYIWLRFEWQFAVGAVVALVHDVVLTIGVFAVTQMEFNLTIIAAILTIVGYSLNDTVVVFDRVRENLRRYKSRELKDVLNLSINETMSRTLQTAMTTLIALIALYVLGGAVIRGFTFAMIWGVIVGTYSSVFVASAILLKLGVKRDWSKPDGEAGTQFANVDA
jgi:preprotein translocase subunit SecF